MAALHYERRAMFPVEKIAIRYLINKYIRFNMSFYSTHNSKPLFEFGAMHATEQTEAEEVNDGMSFPTNTSSIQAPAVVTDISGGNRYSYRVDGAFGGSFAAGARDLRQQPLPWYRRRSYYVDGWTDPIVWRSAVRTHCPLV